MTNKDITYNFLDKNYPIQNGVIDVSFNQTIKDIIQISLGIKDVTFFDWAHDRLGEKFIIRNQYNSIAHFKNNQLHRDDDLPAIILTDNTRYWYQNGMIHRENDKPAVIYSDGTKKWFINNQLHRDNDKPAIIIPDGTKYWYKYGKLHRDNDKPARIDILLDLKQWYINGELIKMI